MSGIYFFMHPSQENVLNKTSAYIQEQARKQKKKAWDAENQETQLSGRTERIPDFLCEGWSQVPKAMSPKGRPEEKVCVTITTDKFGIATLLT